MNENEMLRQMCRDVLTETEIRAICKNRGFPSQTATSRALLESLFLSETGVAAAFRTLDRTEIAMLHLLAGQEKPVDVAFFRRLVPPPTDSYWKFRTYSQRYQQLFSKVKDQLVRKGFLLVAMGRETKSKKSKMERWQFSLPSQFARHLPPLLESVQRLEGAGDWRLDAVRATLKTAVEKTAAAESKNDTVEIVHGELRWGGQAFRADRVKYWQTLQWHEETKPAKTPKDDAAALSPAEAVLRILTGLDAGQWCDDSALASPLKVYCDSDVNARSVCESGWRWGLLAKQESGGRTWYRLAPLPSGQETPPNRYLTDRGDLGVAVNLDAVPLEALETLASISDVQPAAGRPSLCLAGPKLIKLGRSAETILGLPLIEWLRTNSPAFRQDIETISKLHGKTILHENLAVARVGDLSLKVALEKALGNRIVPLGGEFVAFPVEAVAQVKRLVTQMGHVVKEVAHRES